MSAGSVRSQLASVLCLRPLADQAAGSLSYTCCVHIRMFTCFALSLGWMRPCPSTLGKGLRWLSKMPSTRLCQNLSGSARSATRTWSSGPERVAGKCLACAPPVRQLSAGPIVSFLCHYFKAACCCQPPDEMWETDSFWDWSEGNEALWGSEEVGTGSWQALCALWMMAPHASSVWRVVERHELQTHWVWVQIPLLPHTSSVPQSRLLNYSEP